VLLLPARDRREWLATHLAGPSGEGSWQPALSVVAGLGRTVDRLVADGEPPAAAVKYVAGWTAGALAGAVGLVLAGSGAGVRPAAVRWHMHPLGWASAVDLGEPDAVVPRGHPWSGLPGVRVGDPAAEAAEAVVAAATPLVEACHALGRVGRRTLWDEVGDSLGTAVAAQDVVPPDPAAVARLAAAVRTPGMPWRALPSLWVADGTYVGRKGGCCLAYLTEAEPSVPEDPQLRAYAEAFPRAPGEPDYCVTCRFRTPEDCAARQVFLHGRS
jgi:hypothetical protein